MKKIILLTALIVSLSILLIPAFALAQSQQVQYLQDGVDKSAGIANIPTGPKNADVAGLIGTIINAAFGLLGTVVLAFTLLGGVLWMMAGGNEEKVARAKKFIISGIEGMIVIFMAYALVYVVLYALSEGAKRAAGN